MSLSGQIEMLRTKAECSGLHLVVMGGRFEADPMSVPAFSVSGSKSIGMGR